MEPMSASVENIYHIEAGQLVRTSSSFLHENWPYEGLVCQVLRVDYQLKQVELNFFNPLSSSDKAVTLVEKGQRVQRGNVLREVTNPFTWDFVSSHLSFICKKRIF